MAPHLLCDKFVDILVLGQEFLPAQAPVPPQFACGLLALRENPESAPGAACSPSHNRLPPAPRCTKGHCHAPDAEGFDPHPLLTPQTHELAAP